MSILYLLHLHSLLYRLIATALTWLAGLWLGRRACTTKNFSLKIKPAYQPARPHSKPPWVQHEVLRLKALMPHGTGVRKIAATFNRIHAHHTQAGKRQRISKTYVAKVIQSNQLEIQRIRHQVRTRAPGAGPVNRVWGIDLTGKCSVNGQLHFILGIIDHGSRQLLKLAVTTKHALSLATHTAHAAQRYGHPRCVRTDNESCFTSQAYVAQLKLLGIRMQRSDKHCPWQNGRIERLFGTLKQHLNRISFDTAEQLQALLDEFVVWYNTVRPHQHLQGSTPEEVWRGIDYATTTARSMEWWTGWDGLLSGVRLQWTKSL
jgi:putative transposase